MADFNTYFNYNGHTGTNGTYENVGHENGGFMNGERSKEELILDGGSELTEESRSENCPASPPSGLHTAYAHAPTAKSKAAKSALLASPALTPGVEGEEAEIPDSGDVSGFTTAQMTSFFRCLRLEERVVAHLARKQVDGRRFARLSDEELRALGLDTPVGRHFRARANAGKRKKKGGDWRL